jgi:hypothetical protein
MSGWPCNHGNFGQWQVPRFAKRPPTGIEHLPLFSISNSFTLPGGSIIVKRGSREIRVALLLFFAVLEVIPGG